jgi:hypothetical protein
LAEAPFTCTDFTLAFEFSRTVSVRPAAVPTFVTLIVAFVFNERVSCCTVAETPKDVTCQITEAVDCERAGKKTHSMSVDRRSILMITDD